MLPQFFNRFLQNSKYFAGQLLANCWTERREVRKTAAGWTLGCGSHRLAKAVAKLQFQLLTAAFCLSEFFDPCLHLLHRFEHRAIKHLNIAFLGNVRFRVAQDALHHLSPEPPSPTGSRPAPAGTRATRTTADHGLKSWPYYPPREIVHVDGKPTTRVKNHPYFWVTHGPAVFVQDSGQSRNYRHGIAAGARRPSSSLVGAFRYSSKTSDPDNVRVSSPVESHPEPAVNWTGTTKMHPNLQPSAPSNAASPSAFSKLPLTILFSSETFETLASQLAE